MLSAATAIGSRALVLSLAGADQPEAPPGQRPERLARQAPTRPWRKDPRHGLLDGLRVGIPSRRCKLDQEAEHSATPSLPTRSLATQPGSCTSGPNC